MSELSEEETRAAYGWLQDRLDEMEPDRESIEEEDPDLFPALEKLRNALKPATERKAKATKGRKRDV